VTGLEHDELGHPSGSPKVHTQMVAKTAQKVASPRRRFARPGCLWAARRECPPHRMGFHAGPIKEAVDRARAAGDSVSAVHIKHINPLPPGLETSLPASTMYSWWK